MDKETEITAGEYQALAEFRYQLRRFLRFSEEAARAVDLEPQQQRNCAQAGLPSSALSIGTGGPFGAEGPIIMTGGAFGSLIAQFFHLSNSERKTLLVAGAAGGMSATFASPVAAVLLAVELLLFEWKSRSLVPVALASATALVMRRYIILWISRIRSSATLGVPR